jgi:putative membrane-bound dehydrogenase-like protein
MVQGGRFQRQAGEHFQPHTYADIPTIARHRHWTGNQWNEADRARSDASGGGHAHAGAMIYLGGSWPEKYHNQLFMNNIHGARLNLDLLTPAGSGYAGDGAPDFCKTNDLWSQILYLRYGPDGQVYMIDWYDRNQCHHGDVNGHDRSNGRIFKISYELPSPYRSICKRRPTWNWSSCN